MTFSFWNTVTINDFKQDGSNNLQVELNKPHDLEVYVNPLPYHMGSISNYFYIYNPTTGESYRSSDIVPGSGGQYVTVHMDNIGASDGWAIQYWTKGELRALVYFDTGEDFGVYFSFYTEPESNNTILYTTIGLVTLIGLKLLSKKSDNHV